LSGESWEQGQVILSWQDALEGAAVPDDGHNVVLHEFAHQLDQENGAAHGAPLPAAGDKQHDARRWKKVLGQAYGHLQRQVRYGEQGLFDHYGAQSPAEFFAVATEVFFEQGAALAEHYPELYQELSGYYKLDPASWRLAGCWPPWAPAGSEDAGNTLAKRLRGCAFVPQNRSHPLPKPQPPCLNLYNPSS
jgi:Mlc titration factor MtfA (ptsG expression regulator)